MVQPTNQKIIAFENTVCHSQLPRGRGTACRVGPHGEAPGLVRRRRAGPCGQEPSLRGFVGRERRGRVSRSRAGWCDSSRLWAAGSVPARLAWACSEAVRAGGWWCACVSSVSSRRGRCGGVGLGLLACVWEGRSWPSCPLSLELAGHRRGSASKAPGCQSTRVQRLAECQHLCRLRISLRRLPFLLSEGYVLLLVYLWVRQTVVLLGVLSLLKFPLQLFL